jgi:putative ABC transport system permease protein
MFLRFVTAALRFRRRRLLLAFSALTLAATLATALFSVYSDIERKMRVEFRGYGANLVIAPGGDALTIPLAALQKADSLGVTAAPFFYSVGRLQNERIVVARVDFRRAAPLTGYWRVPPDAIPSAGQCLAGAAAAAHFRLVAGQPAALDPEPCTVRAIVSTGGPEDAQIIVPFTGDAASLIQVRADSQRLPEIRAALTAALPYADVRLLHAVAETEANVVLKVSASLFLLMLLILAITTLSVSSNFSALVIERGKEIGILKAIGAAESRIAGLFLAESLLLGLGSTVTGYLAGLAAAWWIGRSIFPDTAAAVGVDFRVFLPVAGVTLAVAAIATLVAAARIWKIRPAVILREE